MNKTEKSNKNLIEGVHTLADSATTLSMPKKPNYAKDSSKTKDNKKDKEKSKKK